MFDGISFQLGLSESIAIVGPNGSGKSTLMLCLLALYRPNKGSVQFSFSEKAMDDSAIRANVSLVAPYLNLYDYLTAEENIVLFSSFAGATPTGKEINALLLRMGLEGRGSDHLGTFSSGMKQRLKYAVALARKPKFLFLDEPTANLDEAGKQIVREVIVESRQTAVTVLATNEPEEYSLAQQQCRLG